MSTKEYKVRESGIELIKVIALLMIVIYHCIITAGNGIFVNAGIVYDVATESLTGRVLQVMCYMGNIGNLIFYIASCWFLVDKSSVRINKVAVIIVDCVVVSIGVVLIAMALGKEVAIADIIKSCFPLTFCLNWFIVAYILIYLLHPLFNMILEIAMALGKEVAIADIIKSCFPLTFCLNWFIVAYILIYLLHPLFNMILESITQHRLLQYNMLFGVLYCVIAQINGEAFFYTDLVGFIGIYFMVAYAKKYMMKIIDKIKINVIMLISGVICLVILQCATNKIGMYVTFLDMQKWNKLCNPMVIVIAFSLFNIFRQIKFKSSVINYVSSLSLLVYILHENYIFRRYFRINLMYNMWCRTGQINILVFVIGFGIGLFIVTILIAMVYKQLVQPWSSKIGAYLVKCAYAIYNKIETLCFHIE